MSTPSLDIFQQIFTLSLKSNVLSGALHSPVTGSAKHLARHLENDLNAFLNSDASGNFSGWRLVGAGVYQDTAQGSMVADNAIALFAPPLENNLLKPNPNAPSYLLTIAGTNANSKVNVDIEEMGVATQEPLLSGNHNILISSGNCIALNNILSLLDDDSKFNAITGNTPVNLTITGHSLGGALTSILALYLKTAYPVMSITTYPTASPSTGNEDFVTAFAAAFPAIPDHHINQPYAVWNANIYNDLDIVPQAWATGGPLQLGNFEYIYHYEPVFREIVDGLVVHYTNEVDGHYRALLRANTASFTGPRPTINPISNYQELLSVALEEHVAAYINEFNISKYISPDNVAGFGITVLNELAF